VWSCYADVLAGPPVVKPAPDAEPTTDTATGSDEE